MAVSVSVTSSIIDVTSGTGTIDDIYTAVGNPAVMSRTGSDPYVYEVYGNRELEFSSGTNITLEANDTLQWTLSAHKYPILDAASGCTFTIEEGATIDADTDYNHYSYIYFYGTVHIQGTSGNHVTIKNMRSIYCYFYNNTAWDWDYVDIISGVLTSGYSLYFRPDTRQYYYATHNFNQIQMTTGAAGSNKGYLYIDAGDYQGLTFNNFTVDGLNYGGQFISPKNIKFQNSVFKNNYYFPRIHGGGGNSIHSNYGDLTPWGSAGRGSNQAYAVVFENCLFKNNYTQSSTRYGCGAYYKGSVKFIDCVWEGGGDMVVGTDGNDYLCIADHTSNLANDKPITGTNWGTYWTATGRTGEGSVWSDSTSYTEEPLDNGTFTPYGGLAVYVGTRTYNNVTNKINNSSGGAHLLCGRLNLTVNDINGDPIEGAMVNVWQSDDKEFFSFRTASDGTIMDGVGSPPCFAYGNLTDVTDDTNYECWSVTNPGEIITNGDFSTGDTTGWTPIAGGGTISVVSNELVITQGGTSQYLKCYQGITVYPGLEHTYSATCVDHNTNNDWIEFGIGTSEPSGIYEPSDHLYRNLYSNNKHGLCLFRKCWFFY